MRKLGKQLRLTETIQPQGRQLALAGYIDESCDLSALFERGGVVRLDLSGVTGLNSTGVKAWLDAHRDSLEPPDLLFECCSPPVVRQLNMIPALLKTGRVVSIQAPYFCPGCKAETLELLELADTIDPPPLRRCAACGGELEFDEIPDHYFFCLAASTAATLPDFRAPEDRHR